MSLYDIQVKSIRGDTKDLSEFRGKVMLIVNTASKCGRAPQYKGLQRLHETYGDQGLAVLGFPSNQFAQELKDEESIAQHCELNYGVTFPLHAMIDVRGRGIHPLFRHLINEKTGFLGLRSIKWNFTKFLIDQNGRVVKRFSPADVPDKIESHIQDLLNK
jgi:glutathione peroxidase